MVHGTQAYKHYKQRNTGVPLVYQLCFITFSFGTHVVRFKSLIYLTSTLLYRVPLFIKSFFHHEQIYNLPKRRK